MRTKKEIRDNVAETTRESGINDLIDEYVNLTLQEINDPAWAFEQIGIRGYNHKWTFNRRKTSFETVATIEDYVLPRDLESIGLVRQEDTPVKVKYLPDDVFFRMVPKPSDSSGNPLYYRLWVEEGLSTRLSADGTIDAVSDSTSDTSAYTVSVVGYDSAGIRRSEVLTLNGTTKVTGSITWNSGRPVRISKSATTNGQITITTSTTTLLVMGEEDRSPRFKIMSLYPIPSAAITIYLEYYTRIRRLENNADVPDLDEKWLWVVRLGALAKVRSYQNKPDAALDFKMYGDGVRSMVKADIQNVDYIPYLMSHYPRNSFMDRMLGDWSIT